MEPDTSPVEPHERNLERATGERVLGDRPPRGRKGLRAGPSRSGVALAIASALKNEERGPASRSARERIAVEHRIAPKTP